MSASTVRMEVETFPSIKGGDRVWLGTERWGRKGIFPVSRTTPTQIVVQWSANHEIRFKRDSGYRLGAGWGGENILSIASEPECAAWDEKARAEELAHSIRATAAKFTEERRLYLWGLFSSDSVAVGAEQWGEERERDGKWTVEMHGLSEPQAEALADHFKRIMAGEPKS
jgi:hypothetical protein